MEPLITTRELKKEFVVGDQTLTVLDHVNIAIPRNKLTVLKGRSGSGKTTLMNMLSTLDAPTSGSIFLEGEEITAMSEAKQEQLRKGNIGFVFQSVALISILTAYENVEIALRIAGYPREKRQARAEECLKMVGLGGRGAHMPQQLSGGEQQRVAIARAIAPHPRIVFADEPTAELDTNTGLQVFKMLKELTQETTLVVTTHDEGLAGIADYVIEIGGGGAR